MADPTKPASSVPPPAVAIDGAEIGVTGLKQFSGYVREEFLKELIGSRGARIFREMRDNSAVIGAMLFAVEMLIRQAHWRIEPADASDSEDVAAAEFAETCREDLRKPWTDFVAEVMSMMTFGYAPFEIVYKKRDDGTYGWDKFALRSQETLLRWLFDDESGELLGMVQLAPPLYRTTEIPANRLIIFRTTSYKDNPEGMSVLRHAYRSWYFAKRIEEIEGIGVERDLAGLPTAYVPARIMSQTASTDEKSLFDTIKRMVRNVRRDEQEGLVLPSDRDDKGNLLFEFKLLSTGGTRNFDTNAIITRYDQRILMTMIADFIMLGTASKTGSFALSSDKTELFATAIGAYMDMICDTFNRRAISELLAVNGLPGKAKLVHGDIESPDLNELSSYVLRLSQAGAPLFPDDELEDALREAANLPKRSLPSAELTAAEVSPTTQEDPDGTGAQ
jgi:hypothetical protein